jgi:hypothetical protein
MIDFTFTPTSAEPHAIPVPFFEEARAKFAPYYAVDGKRLDLEKAKDAVRQELSKLGAGNIHFIEGIYGRGDSRRHGYQVEFMVGKAQGRMTCAGLPLKYDETPLKVLRVKVQALLNLRDQLKAAVTAQVFAPGFHPLVGTLVLPSGNTVSEAVVAQLSAGLPTDRLLTGGE